MTEHSPRPLITPKEAAAILRMDEKTFRGYVKLGKIPFIPIGFGEKNVTRRFDPVDIEAFKEQQKVVACPSTNAQRRRSTTTISGTKESDFTAQRAARMSAMRQRLSERKKRG